MKEENVELLDYLRVMAKRKGMIIGGFLTCVITATIVSFLLPAVYEATATLEIGTLETGTLEIGTLEMGTITKEPFSLPEGVVEMLKNPEIGKEAIKRFNLDCKLQELEKKIKVESRRKAPLIFITAQGKSPSRAVEIADYYAQVVIAEHGEKYAGAKKILDDYIQNLQAEMEKIDRVIKESEERISRLDTSSEAGAQALTGYLNTIASQRLRADDLQKKLQEARLKVFSSLRPTRIIRSPQEPENPIKPRKKLNIVIAGILGLLAASGLAFFREYWERVKSSTG